MGVAGVIAEFNPFHAGHKLHLSETREISGCRKIIAVISGNFVQRGEPALCDKWRRTRMALLSGVDIVLELPVPYVIAGADYFARGSVGVLAATGVVDALSFGSESGDIAAINEAGRILADEPLAYKNALRAGLNAGLSFAAARGDALKACMNSVSDGLLTKPNNGLAIEYCKALRLIGDPMKVFTTHRRGGGPSATKIRREFFDLSPGFSEFLSSEVAEILYDSREKGEIVTLDDFSDVFRYLLFSGEINMGEGLENRFRSALAGGRNNKISELLAVVKTKRYTYTRLQRAVLGVILGVTTQDMKFYESSGGVQYIRVLGFRRESSKLLGEITKKATLPVITNGAAVDEILKSGNAAGKMLAKEIEAGDIYRLNFPSRYHSERGAEMVII
ncbi:MAG: nucleotidyltransferase family protein [Defluviitaleaceae bacterium]|nr:nucleotidyltransferase family protein [Defluviitaleaceae bacterium]